MLAKLVLLAVIGAVLAQTRTKENDIAILNENRSADVDGNYDFGFAAEDGTARVEVAGEEGEVKGQYQYVNDQGQKVVVKYTAGKNGFVVDPSSLPRAPQALPTLPPPPAPKNPQSYDDGQWRPEPPQPQWQAPRARPQWQQPQQRWQAPRPQQRWQQPQQQQRWQAPQPQQHWQQQQQQQQRWQQPQPQYRAPAPIPYQPPQFRQPQILRQPQQQLQASQYSSPNRVPFAPAPSYGMPRPRYVQQSYPQQQQQQRYRPAQYSQGPQRFAPAPPRPVGPPPAQFPAGLDPRGCPNYPYCNNAS